jgi:hypothetical protein
MVKVANSFKPQLRSGYREAPRGAERDRRGVAGCLFCLFLGKTVIWLQILGNATRPDLPNGSLIQ